MIIRSISPSGLQLYADCPCCFLLKMKGAKQEMNGAMVFGSRVHKAIERYHKEGLVIFEEDIQPYLDEYMETYNRDYVECEKFWKVDLLDTDIKLSMRLDLIKDDILIDHKTSKRPYSQEYCDNNRQMTAYSWAWSQQYSEKENKIRLNVFVTDPKPDEKLLHVMETQRSNDDFLDWEAWVREILDGIANDRFEPQKARWHNYESCPMYKEREGVDHE